MALDNFTTSCHKYVNCKLEMTIIDVFHAFLIIIYTVFQNQKKRKFQSLNLGMLELIMFSLVKFYL